MLKKNITKPSEEDRLRERIKNISGSIPQYKPKVEKAVGYVAFLDVLGTKNRISEGDAATDKMLNELIEVAEKIYDLVELLDYTDEIKIIALSDCYIIVCKDYDLLEEFLTMVSLTAWFALSEFDKPIMIRGAVAKGKIWLSDENVIITGEAYIRAYQMETKDAIYPRIIFSEGLHDQLNSIPYMCDYDGISSLDFIEMAGALESIETSHIETIVEKLSIEEEELRLQDGTIFDNNLSLRRKYSWLINYLMKTLEKKEHGR